MGRVKLLLVLALAILLLIGLPAVALAGGPDEPVQPLGDDPGGGGGGALWIQNVELAAGTINKTYAHWYYQDQYFCDGDPDTDWVFVYYLDYQQNPDSLRVYTDDWELRGLIYTVYRGYVKGFAKDSWTVCRVCLGDNVVSRFGGGDGIKSRLWVHRLQ